MKGRRRKLIISEIKTRKKDMVTSTQNIGEEAVEVFRDQFKEVQDDRIFHAAVHSSID